VREDGKKQLGKKTGAEERGDKGVMGLLGGVKKIADINDPRSKVKGGQRERGSSNKQWSISTSNEGIQGRASEARQ